jgi:hypothetical protein
MAEVVQEALNNSVKALLEEWESAGLKIEGSLNLDVKSIPANIKLAAEGLKRIENLLRPEYETIRKTVTPTRLSIKSVPISAQEGIETYIFFEPVKNAEDYKAGAVIELKVKKFPSDVIHALSLTAHSGSGENETMSKQYNWSNSSYRDEVRYTAERLEEDLRIALAVKEYDERHPKKCMEGS